ncbi:MAG: DUF2341 domain-containing protein, partial [Candidatus Subteraquimicrobiales bacterium]|nr:DUF2341 domain-containing protein [Candidatus Subteraquimicrobiales bacterium]
TSASKYTFVGGDNGTKTFAGTGFTLKTTPSMTITITDGTISRASNAITVSPAAATNFVITGSATQIAGATNNLTITARDAFGNTVSSGANNYTGAQSLTFSGASAAPGGQNPTVAGTNFGTGTSTTFTDGVASSGTGMILYNSTETQPRSISATATGMTTSTPLSVTVTPAAIASYTVSAVTPQTAGTGWSETVTAKDAFGNTVTTDAGTAVTLTNNKVLSPALSNDGGAIWLYRKSIPISGSTGAGTGYQVRVRVGESSATGTLGTDVDIRVDGRSTATSGIFNDVRFTDSTGTAAGELSHWRESVTGTTPNRIATYWVKVTADLGTAQSIHIYYGNASAVASTYNSGTNTFMFFDDFETYAVGSQINGQNGWTSTQAAANMLVVDDYASNGNKSLRG